MNDTVTVSGRILFDGSEHRDVVLAPPHEDARIQMEYEIGSSECRHPLGEETRRFFVEAADESPHSIWDDLGQSANNS